MLEYQVLSQVTYYYYYYCYYFIKGWGGNLGSDIIEKFNNNDKLTFGDLIKEDKNDLIQEFGEDLYHKILSTSKGIDNEPVKDRSLNQQVLLLY